MPLPLSSLFRGRGQAEVDAVCLMVVWLVLIRSFGVLKRSTVLFRPRYLRDGECVVSVPGFAGTVVRSFRPECLRDGETVVSFQLISALSLDVKQRGLFIS